MQLTPEQSKPGIRATFKDYGFFIPVDANGMRARTEGVTVVQTHTKAQADHLEKEGAKLTRNEDGSAVETSFVANGVVLTKLPRTHAAHDTHVWRPGTERPTSARQPSSTAR